MKALTFQTLNRAPKGGAVSPVNGRQYSGGQWMPRLTLPAVVEPRKVGLAFDVTRDEGTVAITNTRTGGERRFRIETVKVGELRGKRIVSMLLEDGAAMGFGWVDHYGITAWNRFKLRKDITGENGYIALLTESAKFAAKGIEYRVEG